MIQIEPIDTSTLPDALRVTLQSCASNAPVSRAYVRAFAHYLASERVAWSGWGARRNGALTSAAIAMFLPGPAAVLLLSPASSSRTMRMLLQRFEEACLARGVTYSQSLTESDDLARGAVLADAGFTALTRLTYMERQATPIGGPAEALTRSIEWVAYSERTHARFVDCLASTYVGSADCPEVSQLRSAADSLAAHGASGAFVPALWEIAQVDGHDAGVLLLAPVQFGSVVEIVYVGVTAPYRKRGLGWALLRRALQHCRDARRHLLSLAVDCRNHAAIGLYTRFGFYEVGTRTVFLKVPHLARILADNRLTTCG